MSKIVLWLASRSRRPRRPAGRRPAAPPGRETRPVRPAGRRLRLWLAFVAIAALALRFAPLPPIPTETTPTILDRNGVILYEPLGAGGTRSAWLSEIPPNVERATIAAEDKRFYLHPGIDPIAGVRAFVHDVRRLKIVQGGSTITQQVAKLMLRRNTRWQKLHEAVVALQLEARYSKKEILALYLNLAPYGEQTIGIARASQRTFGCDPEQLTVAQAAYLAALPQRPSAKTVRYRAVLQRMQASRADFAEKLNFDRGRHPILAQHFVERVISLAKGLTIQTTLDAKLQREVHGIIAAAKPELLRHGAHSVAVAVLDNRSGDWLAWEGSGDYFGSDFGGAIDGVVTPRQPGSALKPFTYALAFESGFTPATVLDDVPSHFPTAEEGVVYTPRNYDGRYRGPLRARLALAGSENVPAVQLLSKLGPSSLLRFLRAEGFDHFDRTADYYGLGLTLGDAEVTLEELVRAYATFARGGVAIEPSMLLRGPRAQRRIVSQRTAFWITDILSDPSAREYIFGSGGALDFPFPVAVKTGTSQAYRDNWTIGYTRDVPVGVWVGNFDLSTLRNSSGVTGAGPIFHAVMLAAAKERGDIVERPGELELVPVCALTGLRPSTACPEVDNEWLLSDAPVVFCAHPRSGGTPLGQPARTPAFRITTPADHATYLIDPTLRREFQALRLRASGGAKWSVDGKHVGDDWPLEPGRHVIAAVDERGRRDTVTITVR